MGLTCLIAVSVIAGAVIAAALAALLLAATTLVDIVAAIWSRRRKVAPLGSDNATPTRRGEGA
jgi:hypothetical protein